MVRKPFKEAKAMNPVLKLQDVETSYGEIRALKGVSLEVQAGEIVSLIGSNGAGKTTTLRTISGQLKPRAGKVFFKGECIEKMQAHQVAGLGIAHVPEGRKIFPRLTVEENLEMGAFRIKSKASNQKNLKLVYDFFPRLLERRSQKGGTLSGGEQQMLAIGRALMSEPDILLLDEPSMGLSPLLVQQIFQVIVELNSRGITILLVEQNAHKALNIANRGYVLQNGVVALSGTGEELLNNPMVIDAYLGYMARQFDEGNIIVQTLPGYPYFTYNGVSFWEPDRKIAGSLLNALFAGHRFEANQPAPPWVRSW